MEQHPERMGNAASAVETAIGKHLDMRQYCRNDHFAEIANT